MADWLEAVEYVAGRGQEKGRGVRLRRYYDLMTLRLLVPRPEKMTYQQLASRWGVTRERVRQIEAKMLRIMRHPRNRSRQPAIQTRVAEVAEFRQHFYGELQT